MKTKHIIIGLIILVGVLFFIQKKEHASGSVPATTPQLSNEAIQNIAKIYADTSNTATFNNIRTTGEATIPTLKGATTVDGAINLKGATTVDGDTLFNGNNTFKSSVAGMPSHFPHSDGKNYIRGPTQIDGVATFTDNVIFKGGANPNNWGTHIPWTDGRNYIRGETNMDGFVRMNKGFEGHSPNGAFKLVMQDDGNLVVYRTSDGRAIWDSF